MSSAESPIKNCLCFVDGFDCEFPAPTQFGHQWYSHKFHGPRLRYDVAFSICSVKIVSVYDLLLCAPWSDMKIFKYKLLSMLSAQKGF